MSHGSLNSPELGPILAALSPEAAEPLPNEGDDVVEAYSFNTGDLTKALVAGTLGFGFPCLPTCQIVLCQALSHVPVYIHCAGLMVLMMILYASLGHKIAARYAP